MTTKLRWLTTEVAMCDGPGGDRKLRRLQRGWFDGSGWQWEASDVAARYGGEEFIVLLPNTATSAATLLAERIRSAISESAIVLPDGETATITVSIGIAEVHPSSDNNDLKTLGDSLIARADVALEPTRICVHAVYI